MNRALLQTRNARCVASSEKPGAVTIEFRRADGRVFSLELDHQAAGVFAHRLGLQSKLAELYHNGQKLKGE